MITVALTDNNIAYAGSIDEFSVFVDETIQEVKVYHNDTYIGIFKSVCGIDLDEFISKIKYREN